MSRRKIGHVARSRILQLADAQARHAVYTQYKLAPTAISPCQGNTCGDCAYRIWSRPDVDEVHTVSLPGGSGPEAAASLCYDGWV
jgi:hypothetical protein